MTSKEDFYDAELRRHNEHFRAAIHVGTRDRVLDIGCGAGQTTREAARATTEGSVTGMDVSPDMLARARELTDAVEFRNITYRRGDAETYPFSTAHFDLAISRFGVMFFAHPDRAFANIGRAVRSGGRIVVLVWQQRARNEWAVLVRQALTADTAVAPPLPGNRSDPFSLGDPAATERLLSRAGFTDIAFSTVHEPVYYGPDSDAAYRAVLTLQEPRQLLEQLNGAPAERAEERLRALLTDHMTDEGVLFDSRAWIVTARRA